MADTNIEAGAVSQQSPDAAEGTHDRRRALYGVPGNERIGAFSDGVFAIAITLLVLELQLPAHAPEGGLIALVPEYLPRIAAHIVSFAVLGIYWVGHHNMFMHIKRHDRSLLWLNILFLLFVAATPFTTGLMVEYGDDQLAVITYAGTLVLAGISLDLVWRYATHKHRLVTPGMDPGLVTFVHGRVLLAPAVYLLAIAVSFVSITAAKVLFVIVVIAYIVPNPLDHYHHRQFQVAPPDKK
jgi:TMEM175 potassium channel family protein